MVRRSWGLPRRTPLRTLPHGRPGRDEKRVAPRTTARPTVSAVQRGSPHSARLVRETRTSWRRTTRRRRLPARTASEPLSVGRPAAGAAGAGASAATEPTGTTRPPARAQPGEGPAAPERAPDLPEPFRHVTNRGHSGFRHVTNLDVRRPPRQRPPPPRVASSPRTPAVGSCVGSSPCSGQRRTAVSGRRTRRRASRLRCLAGWWSPSCRPTVRGASCGAAGAGRSSTFFDLSSPWFNPGGRSAADWLLIGHGRRSAPNASRSAFRCRAAGANRSDRLLHPRGGGPESTCPTCRRTPDVSVDVSGRQVTASGATRRVGRRRIAGQAPSRRRPPRPPYSSTSSTAAVRLRDDVRRRPPGARRRRPYTSGTFALRPTERPSNESRTPMHHDPTAASRTASAVKALAFTKTQGSRYNPCYRTHLGIPQHVGVTSLATPHARSTRAHLLHYGDHVSELRFNGLSAGNPRRGSPAVFPPDGGPRYRHFQRRYGPRQPLRPPSVGVAKTLFAYSLLCSRKGSFRTNLLTPVAPRTASRSAPRGAFRGAPRSASRVAPGVLARTVRAGVLTCSTRGSGRVRDPADNSCTAQWRPTASYRSLEQ